MGYWKSKVIPTIKKMFEKKPGKKAAAAEAIKAFDESKEAIDKEIEEKKTELQPKVVETYEATSAEVKALVRDPKEEGLKKHSAEVQKFLDELVKIEFPGSKAVSEASTNFGVSYVTGPIAFVFEKVSPFLPPEENKTRDVAPEEVKAEEETKTEETKAEEPKTEETSGEKDKEIVEEKKEEAKPAEEEKKPEAEEEKKPAEEEKKPAEEEKKEEAAPAAAEAPAKAVETPASEPPKA